MINFHKEDTKYQVKGILLIKQVLSQLVENEGFVLNELNLVLCSDAYILGVNKTYLQHDYFTDIITFDNADNKQSIEGDLFISIDTVRSNARLYKTTILNELRRVMLHGALHLCGYNDKTDEEKVQMRLKEDEYLAYFHS
jgi:probable rRNA maturation factor